MHAKRQSFGLSLASPYCRSSLSLSTLREALLFEVDAASPHSRSGEGCQELPVAIDVAVPVETAAKPSARELSNIEIHVGLAEPGRE